MWWIPTVLAGGPELANAVASGDCATVVEETDKFETQQERWRVPRGWCLLKLGDAAQAEMVLSTPVDGVLGEYGRLILARAHLAQGHTDAADAALEGLSLPGRAGDEVARTRARLAAQRGDVAAFDAAVKSLDAAAELSFLRATALQEAERLEEAKTGYRRVWTQAAVGGWDDQAAERLVALGEPAPKGDETRLKNLRKNGRIDDAADLASTIGGTPSPLELARVNLQARKYTASLENWEKALGAPAEARGSARHLFDYALTHARTGDYETAALVYKRVIAQHPTDAKAVFASYKLGYMAYDKNDCDRAVPLFDEHIRSYPSSKYLDEALWFSARCHWRNAELDEAVAAWSALASKRPKSSLVPGTVYWRARAKGVRGDEAGERASLERVLRSYPTSGYAWFAAARLGHTFPRREPATRPDWPATLSKRTDVQRAEALLAVGFRDWARAELQSVKGGLKTRDDKLAAAWAFIAAGDYRTGKALAKPYCVSPWKEGDPVAQQACTPRPEAGIVSGVAARFDLDPLLPYGIMTAESALKPWVTSVAGARGLMQLMPKEGPRIHEELYPERPYDADDLYSAPYNASMGTAELGLKRQSLEDVLQITDLPAVIASYNGGETAVRRWLTAYDGPPDFDEFSEDVGYTETRKYVKRVLGFVMAYRWVYGDSDVKASEDPDDG